MPSRARAAPRPALPVLLALLLLGACAGGPHHRPVSDGTPRIGPPYTVRGQTYTPADDRHYDAVGLASWYGGAHRGKPTANGEPFDPDAISAAHRTLPLPSYAEVTALDTGRTILVRINDRGPFVAGRILDLSHGAARLLGIDRTGVARVRVRRVEPSERAKTALRAGRPAPPAAPVAASSEMATTLPPPAMLPASPPVAASYAEPPPAYPAAGGGALVQVAALSDRGRAERLLAALTDIAPGEVLAAGSLYRVRLGPFADAQDAATALARAQARGYQDARIVR